MHIDHDWEKSFEEALDAGPPCGEVEVRMSRATNDAFSDYMYRDIEPAERDRLGLHGVGLYVTTTGMYDVLIDNDLEDGKWEIRATTPL